MAKPNLKQIIKIQAAVRGFFTREKFAIQELPLSKRFAYPTFVIGNDPKMPATFANFHEKKDKVALIGTSGMRAVSLACKLGNKHHLPKIIIIDNSHHVITFWRRIRAFMADDKCCATKELFFKNLSGFLVQHASLFRNLPDDIFLTYQQTNGAHYLKQNIFKYFTALCNVYGYDLVRRIVIHTSVIAQSWEDETVFAKLNNILKHLDITKIFMYPSNIVSCVDESKIDKILNNIKMMHPRLSIHTDMCDEHDVPEHVLLMTDQTPSKVKETLFSQPPCMLTTIAKLCAAQLQKFKL